MRWLREGDMEVWKCLEGKTVVEEGRRAVGRKHSRTVAGKSEDAVLVWWCGGHSFCFEKDVGSWINVGLRTQVIWK